MEFKFEINNKKDMDKAIESMRKHYSCQGCEHYMRHYGRNKDGKFFELYTRHCTNNSVKIKKPDDLCDKFEMRGN